MIGIAFPFQERPIRKPLLYPAELRDRMLRSIIFVGCLAAPILPAAAQDAISPACGGESIGTVTAASVTDGRTFITTDGREVRLAGIETPGPKAALEKLISEQSVTLKKAGSGVDRYGRIVAYGSTGDTTIQQRLLEAGDAVVASRAGTKPCADALFAAERTARAAKRGLWADPELGPKSAVNRDEISRSKGRFALIEGRVLGVRESGGAIYLNFGRYYTRDFSVMLLKRNAKRFAFAPKDLEGKRVLVRGIVEMRRGPLIEAERPEQIETIE
jgi:endonuclease YncB( thermonuclease family)